MLSLMIANSGLSLILWRVASQSRLTNFVGSLSISVSCVTLCWSLFGIRVLFSEANRNDCSPYVRKWALGIWAWEFAVGTCPKLLLMLLFIVASVMLLVAERNGTNPWLPENALSSHRPPTPAPELLRQKLKIVPYSNVVSADKGDQEISTIAHIEPVRRSSSYESRRLAYHNSSPDLEAPLRLETQRSASQPTAAALGEALVGPIASLHAILSTQESSSELPRSRLANDSNSPACPICFAPFERSDLVVQMPCDKRHIFHRTCLFTWFDTSGTCPVCRSDLVDLFKEKETSECVQPSKRNWLWFIRNNNNNSNSNNGQDEMV